ncbi:AAA family ATPase [Streptomyces sp. NBC_00727]|uniref:helix-hairpin-helix domain-containing protein n=1 Tax=Streptomyces sp. NBC_00727 TaxID=2903675 RepID=UPI00386AEBB5
MTALPRGESPGPPADDTVATTDEPGPAGAGAAGAAGDRGAARDGSGTEGGDPSDSRDGAAAGGTPVGAAAGDDAHADAGGAVGGPPDGSGAEEAGPDGARDGAAAGEGARDGGGAHVGGSAGGSEAPDAPSGAESDAGGQSGGEGGPGLSEAEAELAAQRELLERIEKRKAEKDGPIDAGAKLSGTAADLLAAVRAVESGQKPATAYFDSPAPTPARRAAPAPEPVRQRAPEPAPAPRAAPPETVDAVAAALSAGGAPAALAGPAASLLGDRAAEILREDPWQLLALPGVGPDQADGFARALLGTAAGPDDERRTAALTGWLLEQAALRGHTALDADQVRTALGGRGVTDPAAAVQHAVAEGVVLVFQDGPEEAGETQEAADEEPTAPVQVLLGLDRYALAEESLADGLARLVNGGDKDADWSQAASAEPSPSAAELIRAAAAHGLVAHTGGEAARAEPAALIAAARRLGLRALGAAHSVDGRRRLAQDAGAPEAAVTLAGLLSGAEGPGRDEEGALALDLLVVLDAPQLDVETGAMLVESLADGTRLVLSGDPDVLGSAGAGQVFADVLAARACPRVVSRTPDAGPIGELVSGIGIGELNQVEAPGKEVVIVPVRDPGEAVHRTVQLVADSVPRAIGVPAADTQVITVGHGGPAGTRALNEALKQRLNPGPGRFGGFDPGDRVAHVPAPGRTVPGAVVSADAEGLHLDCAGTPVVVPQERVAGSVRHAWALSAHQAAGMRWPAAVVVLPGDAARGLTRPWVYTAFGRGERHLSVVHGVDQALPRAVAEVPAQERTTRLRALLEASQESQEQ